MSLQLDRLGPFRFTSFPDLQTFYDTELTIWWQKQAKAIENHEEAQDATIDNLGETDATLLQTVSELQDTQEELEETNEGLAETIDALIGTQADVAGAQASLSSLDGRIIPIESAATYGTGGIDIVSGGVLKMNGTQVLTTQGASVADASGGVTIDAEARTAINSLLARLRAHGIIAT